MKTKKQLEKQLKEDLKEYKKYENRRGVHLWQFFGEQQHEELRLRKRIQFTRHLIDDLFS